MFEVEEQLVNLYIKQIFRPQLEYDLKNCDIYFSYCKIYFNIIRIIVLSTTSCFYEKLDNTSSL